MLLSAVWLVAAPDYEPLITLIAGIAGLLSSRPSRSEVEKKQVPGADHDQVIEPFESEFWPEEGIPEFRSSTSHLTLHVRPSHDAPTASELKVEPNAKIDFSGFRYRTIRPGKVVAKKSGTLTGRNLGRIGYLSRETYYDAYSESVELPYAAGDTFEYLQYRAEGSCFIRHEGYVFDIDYCPWLGGSDELALTKQPVAESWLHVVDKSGKAKGWLCAESGVAEEVGRSF